MRTGSGRSLSCDIIVTWQLKKTNEPLALKILTAADSKQQKTKKKKKHIKKTIKHSNQRKPTNLRFPSTLSQKTTYNESNTHRNDRVCLCGPEELQVFLSLPGEERTRLDLRGSDLTNMASLKGSEVLTGNRLQHQSALHFVFKTFSVGFVAAGSFETGELQRFRHNLE